MCSRTCIWPHHAVFSSSQSIPDRCWWSLIAIFDIIYFCCTHDLCRFWLFLVWLFIIGVRIDLFSSSSYVPSGCGFACKVTGFVTWMCSLPLAIFSVQSIAFHSQSRTRTVYQSNPTPDGSHTYIYFPAPYFSTRNAPYSYYYYFIRMIAKYVREWGI